MDKKAKIRSGVQECIIQVTKHVVLVSAFTELQVAYFKINLQNWNDIIRNCFIQVTKHVVLVSAFTELQVAYFKINLQNLNDIIRNCIYCC